jgi:hypothetical protein
VKTEKIDHRLAESFVRDNWSALASAAWRLFLEHGPGALIVDWRWVQQWSHDGSFRFHPRYTVGTESEEFRGILDSYDPRASIVIAFATDETIDRRDTTPAEARTELHEGTGVAAMTITATPPPPEAHRARGH